MATVTGLTAARMAEIEAASIVDADLVGDDLVLTKHDGTPINVGNVRGPAGPDTEGAINTVKETLLSNALDNGVASGLVSNQSAAIQAWLDALPTGSVGYLPGRGRIYRADTGFTIPTGKGLISDGVAIGSPSCSIRLGSADAKVTVADGWHPEIGGFEVHGGTTDARVANVGLHVGQAICWSFRPITVRYTLQKAIRIERAQNCQFDHLAGYNNDGDVLCIEDGAGNNVIQKFDASNQKGYAVAFRQTVATPTIHPQPSFNTIFAGMIERAHDGGITAPGLVYHGAGQRNRILSGVTLASAVTAGPHSTIKMERVGPGVTASILIIDGVPIYGSGGITTAIEMLGNCVLELKNGSSLNTHLLGFSLTDTDAVYVSGPFSSSAATMASKSSGAIPVTSLILRRYDYFRRQRFMATAAELESETYVVGEGFPRRRTMASGAELWGSGAATPDVQLDHVAGILRVAAGNFQILNGDLYVSGLGKGLRVKEGANAKQGVATLVGGTVTVNNSSITAASRIQLTAQDNNTTGSLRVSARAVGTSFTITSNNAGDSGVVAYEIFEPA